MQCSTDRKFGLIKYVKYDNVPAAQVNTIYGESRIILNMPHPNIIRVRDVFKSKGEIGTTFEWLEGDTL